jgi:NTP pyrophosphatase (non-canonical NTP hydrolase)
MDIKTYREKIKRTHSPEVAIPKEKFRLLQAVVGVSTEAGELLDSAKKNVFQHRKLDKTNMKEELGDLMHYISILLNELDLKLEDVLQTNIDKLNERYADGYSASASSNRNPTKERKILEK